MHGDASLLEFRHKSILVRQEVPDLVVEAFPVKVRDRAGQELLGAAASQTLDQQQDPTLHRAATSS
jgi:hypothetical protein